jgi:hypothetical protein
VTSGKAHELVVTIEWYAALQSVKPVQHNVQSGDLRVGLMFKKRRNEVPAIGIDLVVATGIVSRGHLGNPSLTGNNRCGEVLIGASPIGAAPVSSRQDTAPMP